MAKLARSWLTGSYAGVMNAQVIQSAYGGPDLKFIEAAKVLIDFQDGKDTSDRQLEHALGYFGYYYEDEVSPGAEDPYGATYWNRSIVKRDDKLFILRDKSSSPSSIEWAKIDRKNYHMQWQMF